MPSVISHYLLAKRTEDYIKENYPDEKISYDSILWGAQGPDFLFSFKSKEEENEMREYARLIHTKSADKTLDFICNFARASKNDIDIGYAIGFLTHFVFDNTAHPFVLYGAKQLEKQMDNADEHICHNLIESNLDIIILRYETGKMTNQLNLRKCVPKKGLAPEHMATVYYMMGQAVFGKKYDMDNIFKATKDYCKELKRLNDYTGFKRDFIKRKEKRRKLPPARSARYRGLTEEGDWDYANVTKGSWSDGKSIRTESFTELFEQAYTVSKSYTDIFLSAGNIGQLAKNKSFMGEAKN